VRVWTSSTTTAGGARGRIDRMGDRGFGRLVHGWRDRLSPHDVGLPATASRRALGLRREELAALAGLSADYLVRLEQGRAVNPSAQVVASLARALQLSHAERDQLFLAAGLLPPRDGTIDTHVPAGVLRLVSRLGEAPLAVFAADWSLVHWNRPWAALLGDPGLVPPADRNLARAVFGQGPASAALRLTDADLDALGRAVVADLKAATTRYPADGRLAALVSGLAAGSERFAALWRDSAPVRHASERKTIRHPVVGDLTLDCDVLDVPGADLHVVVYSAAAGSTDHDKLAFLRTGAAAAEPVDGVRAPRGE
jgi:transcriptional regulator with XRE-family HTH domain